ncbi:NADH-quinone oxidoreductase subunit C [Streptomyces sp. GQFP]|uniref:NADH-quinone oxidoreductase subunit C n=1 Tax=Streptomyces sp. GQFP TaxID=2907545 RepID=UPI001F229312|nr:NADH-quinone oxidoreductase subunit C [Streptomyces sp. GQFP]UIX31550.1 NADH-quinone oxidoreductase subunit C [Streptomyces sp. GQFP]
MTATGWLPAPTEDLFGTEATAEESYDVLTVDVPPTSWTAALETARDRLSCTYFDWLSAVDEPGTGFRVAAHVVALSPVRRLLVRTTVPHESPVLPSLVDVYAGAAWHERETHEMFGVRFEGHPGLDHLLLPETFEGHPLRKDFVLAARVAKAWPGAKEPGESEHGGPKRRQMLPPGVPDPNEWGPLKGQLPPAPTRPPRAAAGRTPTDRPARRTRTTSEGSASQASAGQSPAGPASQSPAGQTPAGQTPAGQALAGPASQSPADPSPASPAGQSPASPAGQTPAGSPRATEGTPAEAAPSATPRRSRSASQGSASQRPQTPPTEAAAPEPPPTEAPKPPPTADAPWHHARPAFDEPTPKAPEPTEASEPTKAPAPTEAPAPEAPAREAPAPEAPAPETPTPEDPAPEKGTPENPSGGSQ